MIVTITMPKERLELINEVLTRHVADEMNELSSEELSAIEDFDEAVANALPEPPR